MGEPIYTIRKEGASRVIAITKFIPESWQIDSSNKIYVTIKATENGNKSIQLILTKVG